MAIHVDPNKSARRTTIRLCFSQECPVIYRNFSGIIFLTTLRLAIDTKKKHHQLVFHALDEGVVLDQMVVY